jgi:hypothetical protein
VRDAFRGPTRSHFAEALCSRRIASCRHYDDASLTNLAALIFHEFSQKQYVTGLPSNMPTAELDVLKPIDPSIVNSDDYEIYTLSNAQVFYAGNGRLKGKPASLLDAYADTPLRVEGTLEAPDRSQQKYRTSTFPTFGAVWTLIACNRSSQETIQARRPPNPQCDALFLRPNSRRRGRDMGTGRGWMVRIATARILRGYS